MAGEISMTSRRELVDEVWDVFQIRREHVVQQLDGTCDGVEFLVSAATEKHVGRMRIER